jgi:pimeloyl-ACP methyl ester carboxylesterase
VRDLETVVDAAEAEHFVLLGMSQGCAVAIAFAVSHPERVSHLILYGGYALGEMKRAATEEEREKVRSIVTLARLGWNDENSAYRQIFTSRMLSDATKERMDAFNEFLRKAASPECAARYQSLGVRLMSAICFGRLLSRHSSCICAMMRCSR